MWLPEGKGEERLPQDKAEGEERCGCLRVRERGRRGVAG